MRWPIDVYICSWLAGDGMTSDTADSSPREPRSLGGSDVVTDVVTDSSQRCAAELWASGDALCGVC